MRAKNSAWAIAALAALQSCRSEPDVQTFPVPGMLRSALESVSELSATAQLVPEGGSPATPVSLERAADGVSFTGFLAAEPGRYTLELAFSGQLGSGAAPLFLGRWTSDLLTVIEGQTTNAVFSLPLDPSGRSGDESDLDSDGLSNLDEILDGTNPANADSDQDGVPDGSDCAPMDETKSVDCGPPGGDEDPPVITLLEPAGGEAIGCQRSVRARIQDASTVSSATLDLLEGNPPQVLQSIEMQERGGGEWDIPTLEVSTNFWLSTGAQDFRIRAGDASGNQGELSGQLNLQIEIPAASMTPIDLDDPAGAFAVNVTASAPSGISEIRLMRVSASNPTRSAEVLVDSAASGDASFSVDLSNLPSGEYFLYPLVTDAVGNQLKPDDTLSPTAASGGGFETDAVYDCLFDTGGATVPVGRVRVGTPVVTQVKMRAHFDEAVSLAASEDAQAVLIEIRGWGLQPDGNIRLDDAIGAKLWRYQFLNFTTDRHIQITWYSTYWGILSPEVEVTENWAFTATTHPIQDPTALVDSDVAAAAYSAVPACMPLTGNENDDIRYISDEPFTSADVIRISVDGGNDYKGTAVAPVTDIWQCN